MQNKASESTTTTDDAEPAKKKRKPSKKTKKATAVKEEKPKSDKTYIEQLNFKVTISQILKENIRYLHSIIEIDSWNCIFGLYFSH